MKQNILVLALLFLSFNVVGQNKTHKLGFTVGGSIQHYNGNLGSSFFKFRSACFGGVTTNFAIYLNKSFDLNIGNSIGHYGFCPSEEDKLKAVPDALKCPGENCANLVGMGNLSSMIISSNVNLRYKLANGSLLSEEAKLAPYVYAGVGMNQLIDIMKKNCVNTGLHFTVNAGTGLIYNLNERWNVGYNMDVSVFMKEKVYLTNADVDVDVHEEHEIEEDHADDDHHQDDALFEKFERRKDLCLRNSVFVGFNF